MLEPRHGQPGYLGGAGTFRLKERQSPLWTPPRAARKPPRVHVTPEDLERFGDEDLMRGASNDDWLRDEAPPHHRL
jgi:hypothetical protein